MAGKASSILEVLIFSTAISVVSCVDKETQSYGIGKLLRCNPKYFSLCHVLTTPTMVNGVERLITNHTFVNVDTLGNNFTVAGIFINQKGTRYKIEHKLCDYFKQFWMQSYLKTVHIKLICPAKPGTNFIVMEIPPPYVPVPMMAGTYHLEGEMYTTRTKELAVEISYTIHFSDSYKNNRQNRNKKNKG